MYIVRKISHRRTDFLIFHCQYCQWVCYLLCKQSCNDDSESETEYRAHRAGRPMGTQPARRWTAGASESAGESVFLRIKPSQTMDSVCRSVGVFQPHTLLVCWCLLYTIAIASVCLFSSCDFPQSVSRTIAGVSESVGVQECRFSSKSLAAQTDRQRQCLSVCLVQTFLHSVKFNPDTTKAHILVLSGSANQNISMQSHNPPTGCHPCWLSSDQTVSSSEFLAPQSWILMVS